MQKLIQSRFSKNPKESVDWEYDGQEYAMRTQAKNIAYHVFDHLVELGKPMYQEVPFEFVIGHRLFRGRIDGIRIIDGKIVIEDYKTGRPWIGQMKVKHDPQMSMYNVGLAALCFRDSQFAASLGLEERRHEFRENPTYLVEEIKNRFIMLEAPHHWASVDDKSRAEKVPFMHPTTRRVEHFYEILKVLDGIEKSLKHGHVYPERGRKCDSCVMKKACESRLEDVLSDVPIIKGQIVFNFAAPGFAIPMKREMAGVQDATNFAQEELLFTKGRFMA